METKNFNLVRSELQITIDNKSYKVFSIGTINNAFYYHFDYPKGIKQGKVFNYSNKTLTGRPDHISFHTDGTVHLKLKNDSRGHNIEQMQDKTFFPLDHDKLTPLLIHSITTHDEEYMLPLIKENRFDSEQKVICYQLPSIQSFSIILFLSPSHRSINELLNHQLPSSNKNITFTIGLVGSHAFRIPAKNGWVIDCIITDSVLLSSNAPFDKIYQSFAYSNLHLLLENFILQKQDIALKNCNLKNTMQELS